jgi:hypothetical protein
MQLQESPNPASLHLTGLDTGVHGLKKLSKKRQTQSHAAMRDKIRIRRIQGDAQPAAHNPIS